MFTPENLTNEQLIKLLDGWNARNCGSNPRPFLIAAVQSRLNLGRLTQDDIMGVV